MGTCRFKEAFELLDRCCFGTLVEVTLPFNDCPRQ